MVLIAFYIVIRWLGLLEEEIKEILPYGMLCVLGVFLMTVKLSAALILLLDLSGLSSAAGETVERDRKISPAGYRDGTAVLYQKCIAFGVAGVSFYPDRSV